MPNLSKNLKKDLKKVESLMRKNLSKEPVVKDLYDYIFDKSGKKVRASISLISSYGMNKNQQNRVKLAAIIELLHTATLVHDDIIDNSDLRRGKTTVNVVWSNSHGVLIGDFIFDRLKGLHLIEKKRNKVRYKYGQQLKFTYKPSLYFSNGINSLGMELTLNVF